MVVELADEVVTAVESRAAEQRVRVKLHGHPGAPAALPTRHDCQRVHAGAPEERTGDGRIGVLDADETKGKRLPTISTKAANADCAERLSC